MSSIASHDSQAGEGLAGREGVTWSVVAAWSEALFSAAGLDHEAAKLATANLVYAEQRGFASHGFIRLPIYVARIRGGGINRRPRVRVVSEQAGLAIVDADDAIGAYSAAKCVDLVIAKASSAGAAVVIARSANHFGAAGHYTDQMARSGFVGIAICNTDVLMCAPFGGLAVLGSNPLSIAVPALGGLGPQLDMATTEASYGKILVARDNGQQIPAGWAVDASGAPTTDPAAALEGALLPSGGPKGFGLAFMVDCIVAIAGAETSPGVAPLYGEAADPQRLGHAFIAIAVDGEKSRHEYDRRVANLVTAVHESRTTRSLRDPMVPGEPEKQRLQQLARWTPDAALIEQLLDLSRQLSVDVPDEIDSLLDRDADC